MSPLSDSEFYAELDRRMAMTEEDWKDFSRPLRRISNVDGLGIPRPASQSSTTPEDLNPVSNMNPQDFPSAAQSAQTAPENEREAHMEVDHFPDLDPTGASSPLPSWTESPEKRKSSPIEDKPGRDAKRTRILSPELDASDPILPEDVRQRGATSISVAERTSNCEEISHFTETAIAPIYRPKHSAVETQEHLPVAQRRSPPRRPKARRKRSRSS
ncbi:hypothetical protein BV25DRAFT_1536308 [Artomyces pyxidatus]|uniref:Uncharacterized protein n=1 Tax=Artomyces pyxidatus TaxID=48021 RepID=A0ACB8SKS6_9AGAM|nr:hypothetical protein BV25DRAFT_1536308 [Artomyces pyxidatus]